MSAGWITNIYVCYYLILTSSVNFSKCVRYTSTTVQPSLLMAQPLSFNLLTCDTSPGSQISIAQQLNLELCQHSLCVSAGHDSYIGRACILCSHSSIGASSSLGDNVVLGSRAAVKDHVSLAAGTRVAAKSGVVRDVTVAGDYAGHPAMRAEDFKVCLQHCQSAQMPGWQYPSWQRELERGPGCRLRTFGCVRTDGEENCSP